MTQEEVFQMINKPAVLHVPYLHETRTVNRPGMSGAVQPIPQSVPRRRGLVRDGRESLMSIIDAAVVVESIQLK